MSIHALFLDLLCLPLTLCSFLLAGTGKAFGSASLRPAHRFDTTAPLWLLPWTHPAEATGIWSRRRERLACLWSTAAQNKSLWIIPVLTGSGERAEAASRRPATLSPSVTAGGRCDTLSFCSVHYLSSLSCHHFSPLATSHAAFPRFCPSFFDSAAARKPLWLTPPFSGMLA